MELIPRALVVGLWAATQPGSLDRDRVNRIWSELSTRQEYRQLTYSAEGVHFAGDAADDGLVIQPPLVQIRSAAKLGLGNAADEAVVAVKTVARHLGYAQFVNLGIKHVYHAPVPDGGAREFVMRRLLRRDPASLDALERGGELWGGVKYVVGAVDQSVYTVVVEPLLSDDQFLFIVLDAQFSGLADPDRIRDHSREAEEYADRAIRQYLEEVDYSS